ncbi:hypothetical protein [Methylomagnum sp.]
MHALSLNANVADDHVLKLTLPPEFPTGLVKITVEPLTVPASEPYQPQTELGKRLMEIRQRAIAKGMPLMSQDEVLAEVRRRRGEDD